MKFELNTVFLMKYCTHFLYWEGVVHQLRHQTRGRDGGREVVWRGEEGSLEARKTLATGGGGGEGLG